METQLVMVGSSNDSQVKGSYSKGTFWHTKTADRTAVDLEKSLTELINRLRVIRNSIDALDVDSRKRTMDPERMSDLQGEDPAHIVQLANEINALLTDVEIKMEETKIRTTIMGVQSKALNAILPTIAPVLRRHEPVADICMGIMRRLNIRAYEALLHAQALNRVLENKHIDLKNYCQEIQIALAAIREAKSDIASAEESDTA